MIRYWLVLLMIFPICCMLSAQNVRIGIFYGKSISSCVFNVTVGKYEVYGDSVLLTTLKKNEVINVIATGDSVKVQSIEKKYGVFRAVKFIGTSHMNYARIRPVVPELTQRMYDDDFIFDSDFGKLRIINDVGLENYIAGVVESEGGQRADIEYYKCQAIITRTYALENYKRHETEGFNLCDGVHCQAYKCKSLSNPDITDAAALTSGLVIVDSTLNLITAAFHSNCGGETCGSEHVWVKPMHYLSAIKDTFCLNGNSAGWTKTIPLQTWKTYLRNNGIRYIDSLSSNNELVYLQPVRKAYYKLGRDSIPMKKIRNDMGFRSSYFSVSVNGSEVTFTGKGYGHGVGLCQEGAMNMAKQGYNYQQIIKYYYKNVYIVSLRALDFFKE